MADVMVDGTTFGIILLIVGLSAYIIDDAIDPPTAFIITFCIPPANAGEVAVILVCVNVVIATGDAPIVNVNGLCTVL